MNNLLKHLILCFFLALLGCSKIHNLENRFIGDWELQRDVPAEAKTTNSDVALYLLLTIKNNNTFQRKSYANNQLLEDGFGEWKEISENELLLTFKTLGKEQDSKAKLTSNTFKVAYLDYGKNNLLVLTKK